MLQGFLLSHSRQCDRDIRQFGVKELVLVIVSTAVNEMVFSG